MSDKPRDPYQGLGIGLGLTLFGALCVGLLPTYLGTTGAAWQLFWSLIGGVFGLVGVAGALTEISRIADLEGMGDLGAVVVLAGIAGILHVSQAAIDSSWTIAVRSLVVLLGLAAIIGASIGLAKIVSAWPARADRARAPRRGYGLAVLSVLTALVGLVTAVVNFMGTGVAS